MSAKMPPVSPAAIPGYTFGSADVARSPLSDTEFDDLKASLLFSQHDVKALQMAHAVLSDQVEDVLDVWYGVVGASPHLVKYFAGANGEPDPSYLGAYLGAVRKRFGAWIMDTTRAAYDRAWPDYQYETGLRHTRMKENRTDHIASTAAVIHMRYLIAFVVPLTVTMKPFLAKKATAQPTWRRCTWRGLRL